MIRFHFEDKGQDFLWWDVEVIGKGLGKVVDCGPFQAWAWANGNYFVNLDEPHDVGDRLVNTDDLQRSVTSDYCRVLKYRITKVEHVEAVAGAA